MTLLYSEVPLYCIAMDSIVLSVFYCIVLHCMFLYCNLGQSKGDLSSEVTVRRGSTVLSCTRVVLCSV